MQSWEYAMHGILMVKDRTYQSRPANLEKAPIHKNWKTHGGCAVKEQRCAGSLGSTPTLGGPMDDEHAPYATMCSLNPLLYLRPAYLRPIILENG
jgi:hypothetical protein